VVRTARLLGIGRVVVRHCGALRRGLPEPNGIVIAINTMYIVLTIPRTRSAGTTMVETMIAVSLVAAFFATIFELNAVCLRYIDASKESLAGASGSARPS
jgi:hypothetical protein